VHVIHVGGERHGRRTDVAVVGEVLTGAIPSRIGQRVTVRRAPSAHCPAHLHEALGARALDERLNRAIWQPKAVGKHESGGLAHVQGLREQLLEPIRREAGRLYGRRHRRRRRLLSLQRCKGCNGAH
jgi:hypothetical protein